MNPERALEIMNDPKLKGFFSSHPKTETNKQSGLFTFIHLPTFFKAILMFKRVARHHLLVIPSNNPSIDAVPSEVQNFKAEKGEVNS